MITATHNPYSLSMVYAGYKRVGTWWNYKNVISPFYRLYYVEGGAGRVYVGNTCYELTAGSLFLIPKFTSHSYKCDDYMDKHYICFFDDLNGALGLPQPARLRLKVPAQPGDDALVKRYMALNPHRELTLTDHLRSDPRRTVYEPCGDADGTDAAARMESAGILLQLFSRFVTAESMKELSGTSLCEQIGLAMRHISLNLDRRIRVTELAELVHVTPAHFARVFRSITGMVPREYIQMNRIERAQELLMATDMNIGQIAVAVGLDPSQFTQMFTRIVRCPPRRYRLLQMLDYGY